MAGLVPLGPRGIPCPTDEGVGTSVVLVNQN